MRVPLQTPSAWWINASIHWSQARPIIFEWKPKQSKTNLWIDNLTLNLLSIMFLSGKMCKKCLHFFIRWQNSAKIFLSKNCYLIPFGKSCLHFYIKFWTQVVLGVNAEEVIYRYIFTHTTTTYCNVSIICFIFISHPRVSLSDDCGTEPHKIRLT